MWKLLIAAILFTVGVPVGAQERLSDQLRKGITEEEANRNVDKAIQSYQAIVARYDEDRKVAGTALFRLAECYRKAGKREQAIATYQRVVREFGDQAAILSSSRQQLAALGAPEGREKIVSAETDSRKRISAENDARQKVRGDRLAMPKVVVPEGGSSLDVQDEAELRAQIDLMKKQLLEAQKNVELGKATQDNLRALEDRLHAYEQEYQAQIRAREAYQLQARQERMLTERMIKSIDEETKLVEDRIKTIEAKIAVGAVSKDDAELLQLRRDKLALQRKLEELRAKIRR